MLFMAKKERQWWLRAKASLCLDLSWELPFPHSPSEPHSRLPGLARGKAPNTHTCLHAHTPLSGTYWRTRSFSAELG